MIKDGTVQEKILASRNNKLNRLMASRKVIIKQIEKYKKLVSYNADKMLEYRKNKIKKQAEIHKQRVEINKIKMLDSTESHLRLEQQIIEINQEIRYIEVNGTEGKVKDWWQQSD
jgi:hypothetical protein